MTSVLVTVTATAGGALADATDLGFLLHKHPDRVQQFDVAAGVAHVLYPEASPQRCTAALLLEVDPDALAGGRTRGRRPVAVPDGFALGPYVNDRPYAASSLLAVALGAVFRTALRGTCVSRPELAASPIPLELAVPSLRCSGGAELATSLFAPLGWQVDAEPVPLDVAFPAWGDSRYLRLRLTGEVRLADALNQLYVLLPVLDDAKHYWVSPDEVDKLLRAGEGWLAGHPQLAMITERYLRRQRPMVRSALERLAEVDDAPVEDLDNAVPEAAGPDVVGPDVVGPGAAPPLGRQRVEAVLAAVRAAGGGRVLDLGCGEGALVGALLDEPSVGYVLGADVSVRALQVAARRLDLDRMPPRRRERVELAQTALTYRDRRLEGFDVAVLMEVVEHVDPPRLPALERAVFGFARPRLVLVTTPNVEHNVRYPFLAAGELRHRDHRFEWTRSQFADWADGVARRFGYAVQISGVGPDDAEVGAPTQLAAFTLG